MGRTGGALLSAVVSLFVPYEAREAEAVGGRVRSGFRRGAPVAW